MLLAGLAGSDETATSAKAIALQARDQMLSTQMQYFDHLFVDHRTACLFTVEGFGSFSVFLSRFLGACQSDTHLFQECSADQRRLYRSNG
jgi:hypothetical protein